jgi:glucokinase
MKKHVIGVDIGGTNIRVALLNEELEIIRKETDLSDHYRTSEEFFAVIHKMLRKVDSNNEADAIGMAIPAPWTNHMTRLKDVTNVPCIENISIEALQDYFAGYSLFIENDANLCALLESDCGAAKTYDNSIYITISTGIGSGIILNNHIYHGAHGYAGEIGSITISEASKDYVMNTLEGLCSGKALDQESSLWFGNGADTKELFLQYDRGNKTAKDIIEKWLDHLASGLASVIQIFDPEVIVIGGPVVLNHTWILDRLKERIAKRVLGKLADQIEIVPAQYGTEVGIIGAGYYAFKQKRREEYEKS